MTRATPDTVVVVGASVAGVSAAQALRANGFGGRIVLADAERERPHDKPALSKDFLTGALDEDDIELFTHELVAELDIDLALGDPALRLETDRRIISFRSRQIAYDGAIIATGARPILPPMLHGKAGVYLLRNIADARAIAARMLDRDAKVVVVGGGFIGCEVAASAKQLGLDVTIVESCNHLLGRALPVELAQPVASLHASMGVELRCGSAVVGLTGSQQVSGVQLADGTLIPADLVVVGLGATPVTEWLAGSELAIDDGVVTDAALRTSAPGVFAAGDVARRLVARGQLSIRSEHWTDARQQGALAARNLISGANVPYDSRGYVWSDHYGRRLQMLGRCDGALEFVSGGKAAESYVAIARRDSLVVGVVAFDAAAGFKRARREMTNAFGGSHEARAV